MKQYFLRLALALLICSILPQPSQGEVGNNNPTGVTGEYSGSITTAGSYDPYTGNAKRIVDDIVVTGSLGAYPLKWTRILNTREPGLWSHGYNWSLWIRRPDTQNYDPPYDGWDGCVSYPDGRKVQALWDGETYSTGGGEIGDRIVSTGGDNYDLLMKDGGRVRFQATNPGAPVVLNYVATAIIDPYGLTTELTRDSAGRLWKITQPGGRFLQINYISSLPSSLLASVQAYAASGNLVETVTYVFEPRTFNNITSKYLTKAMYDDGAVATYTYQANNRYDVYYGLIETCHDPRYAGAMKNIKYEFMNYDNYGLPSVGQVRRERNATTGQIVSEVIYPQNGTLAEQLRRTEKRGDGSNITRTFQYSYEWPGELTSYTDFEGHGSGIRIEGQQGDNYYFKVFTDARTHETRVKKEMVAGAVLSVKRGNWPAVIYHYTDDQNPYYLDSKTDERGKITTYARDNNHRIQRTDYPDGGWEEFTYNDFGQVVTRKWTNGIHIAYDHYEYDGRGRLLKRWDPTPLAQNPPVASPPVPYSSFAYYESGPWTDRVYRSYDQLNHYTEYRYDCRGNVTRVTHHDGTYTQSGYNLDGTLAWSADENHPGAETDVNQRTRYEYDEYKRVMKVTNPLTQFTTYSYDPGVGESIDQSLTHTTSCVYRTVSPMFRKTDYEYDRNFRRIQTIQAPNTADQAITVFVYDEVGNLHSTEDPRHKITTYEYNDRNQRTSVTNNSLSPAETTTLDYDEAGNKKTETRQDTSFRSWDYDAMNRIWHAYGWRMPGQPTPTTTYVYDKAGNVRTITDAKQAVYGYDYDLKNLKISQTYPVDATNAIRMEAYAYDDAGNLVYAIKHPSEQHKQIHYDNRNRPDHSWHYGGGVVGPDIVTSYDNASRVQSIVTNNGETTVAFGYDNANRKIWEDQTLADQPTRRVKTDLDADGKRLNLQIVDPGESPFFGSEMQGTGSYSVTYEYTQRDQLKNIHADDGAWAFNYSYDPSGNMTMRESQYSGRSCATRCPTENYDALNRPTTWEQTGPNGFHALSHYQYDQVNREVATWREEEDNKGERFTYEPTNQLATAAYNGHVANGPPPDADRTVSYAYTPDKLNRSSMTDSTAGVTTYSPNALNQYMSTAGNSYSYDSNFNLTHATGFNGVYDAASHLVSASNGGSGEAQQTIAGFVYDGLGRCVKRTLNGVATLFVYDGWKPIAEFDAWDDFLAWNLYGPGEDEILLRQQGKYGYIRFQLDRHGNVAFLMNENAEVIEKYKYDAFGRPTVTDANGGNPRSWSYYGHCFLFQGREFIRELGIYDYRNRFYLPALGRFLQSDPLGFGAGDINLFRYVGDDPIDGSDPTGLIMENSAWNRLMAWQDGEDGSVSEQLNPPTKSISAANEGAKPMAFVGLANRIHAARAATGKDASDSAEVEPITMESIRMSPAEITKQRLPNVDERTRSFTRKLRGKTEASQNPFTGKIRVYIPVGVQSTLPNNTNAYDGKEASQRTRAIQSIYKADAAVKELAARGFHGDVNAAKRDVTARYIEVIRRENARNIIETDVNQDW